MLHIVTSMAETNTLNTTSMGPFFSRRSISNRKHNVNEFNLTQPVSSSTNELNFSVQPTKNPLDPDQTLQVSNNSALRNFRSNIIQTSTTENTTPPQINIGQTSAIENATLEDKLNFTSSSEAQTPTQTPITAIRKSIRLKHNDIENNFNFTSNAGNDAIPIAGNDAISINTFPQRSHMTKSVKLNQEDIMKMKQINLNNNQPINYENWNNLNVLLNKLTEFLGIYKSSSSSEATSKRLKFLSRI